MRTAIFSFLLFAFCGAADAGKAPPAQAFQKLDGCTLVHNEWNDGDSFHVQWQGKEFIFRLYFVDTPEAESSLPERVAEQAADFGISPADSVRFGKDASRFTASILGGGPFTVWTRWKTALGRSKLPRYYAIIGVNGNDLGEQLVANGLARIHGVRTPLPDGRDSRAYLAQLSELETEAKSSRHGAWGILHDTAR